MRKNLTRALFALALIVAPAAHADGPGDGGPNVAAPPVRAQPTTPPRAEATPPAQTAAAPQGRNGVIALNENLSLNVPADYRFYSAEEARAYMQRNNVSAPSGETLGMVARAGADVRAPGTWASIVSYDEIGYVQPATASGLSDADFEAEVREARAQQNRAFEGFFSAPSFNANAPYVAWAERSAAPAARVKDLRHEQKVLGRRGVAGLTTIGAADQMPQIEAAASTLRGMLTFPSGRRHSDFDAANDTVSAYTVPALVTGVAPVDPNAQAAAPPVEGQAQTNFGGLAGWFPWIALGVVGLAIAGFLMMRRRGDDDFDDGEA